MPWRGSAAVLPPSAVEWASAAALLAGRGVEPGRLYARGDKPSAVADPSVDNDAVARAQLRGRPSIPKIKSADKAPVPITVANEPFD